ncbi:hypothetical protein B9Z65_7430 [Elsinoe australis]|uniref:Zn(2)-C6 fungal-type domain-containing protein n=1 Tax=Elsinoe australis TaxID=40998 RepID=A0A2P7YC53_9PEZI|nr:hypothetical protein B9Z65_7430 [Elsinoe australis]
MPPKYTRPGRPPKDPTSFVPAAEINKTHATSNLTAFLQKRSIDNNEDQDTANTKTALVNDMNPFLKEVKTLRNTEEEYFDLLEHEEFRERKKEEARAHREESRLNGHRKSSRLEVPIDLDDDQDLDNSAIATRTRHAGTVRPSNNMSSRAVPSLPAGTGSSRVPSGTLPDSSDAAPETLQSSDQDTPPTRDVVRKVEHTLRHTVSPEDSITVAFETSLLPSPVGKPHNVPKRKVIRAQPIRARPQTGAKGSLEDFGELDLSRGLVKIKKVRINSRAPFNDNDIRGNLATTSASKQDSDISPRDNKQGKLSLVSTIQLSKRALGHYPHDPTFSKGDDEDESNTAPAHGSKKRRYSELVSSDMDQPPTSASTIRSTPRRPSGSKNPICLECKKRKKGCDRGKPCSNCLARNKNCIYPSSKAGDVDEDDADAMDEDDDEFTEYVNEDMTVAGAGFADGSSNSDINASSRRYSVPTSDFDIDMPSPYTQPTRRNTDGGNLLSSPMEVDGPVEGGDKRKDQKSKVATHLNTENRRASRRWVISDQDDSDEDEQPRPKKRKQEGSKVLVKVRAEPLRKQSLQSIGTQLERYHLDSAKSMPTQGKGNGPAVARDSFKERYHNSGADEMDIDDEDSQIRSGPRDLSAVPSKNSQRATSGEPGDGDDSSSSDDSSDPDDDEEVQPPVKKPGHDEESEESEEDAEGETDSDVETIVGVDAEDAPITSGHQGRSSRPSRSGPGNTAAHGQSRKTTKTRRAADEGGGNDGDDDNKDDEDPHRRQMRRAANGRTSEKCQFCIEKHYPCDGTRPMCGPCLRSKHAHCIYSGGEPGKGNTSCHGCRNARTTAACDGQRPCNLCAELNRECVHDGDSEGEDAEQAEIDRLPGMNASRDRKRAEKAKQEKEKKEQKASEISKGKKGKSQEAPSKPRKGSKSTDDIATASSSNIAAQATAGPSTRQHRQPRTTTVVSTARPSARQPSADIVGFRFTTIQEARDLVRYLGQSFEEYKTVAVQESLERDYNNIKLNRREHEVRKLLSRVTPNATFPRTSVDIPDTTDEVEIYICDVEDAAALLESDTGFSAPSLVRGAQDYSFADPATHGRPIEQFLNSFRDDMDVQVQDWSAGYGKNDSSVKNIKIGQFKARLAGKKRANELVHYNALDLPLRIAFPDRAIPSFFKDQEDAWLLNDLDNHIKSTGKVWDRETRSEKEEGSVSASRTNASAREDGIKPFSDKFLIGRLAEGGALTAPHQDSSGYGTWVTLQEGKLLWLWLHKPTKAQLKTVFGTILGHKDAPDLLPEDLPWRGVVLEPGWTFVMPPGTMHAVVRTKEEQTLMFAGHYLRRSELLYWVELVKLQWMHAEGHNENSKEEVAQLAKMFKEMVTKAKDNVAGGLQAEAFGGVATINKVLKSIKEFEKIMKEYPPGSLAGDDPVEGVEKKNLHVLKPWAGMDAEDELADDSDADYRP